MALTIGPKSLTKLVRRVAPSCLLKGLAGAGARRTNGGKKNCLVSRHQRVFSPGFDYRAHAEQRRDQDDLTIGSSLQHIIATYLRPVSDLLAAARVCAG